MIRVICCTHNGAAFLAEQLASILAQSQPVQVIHLFDFASEDGTAELAAAIGADAGAAHVRFDIRRCDFAPGAALSFFHALATVEPECGEEDVIFLSDQDDVWLQHKVRTVVSRLVADKRHASDRILLFHDVAICDADLRVKAPSHYLGDPFVMPDHLDPDRLLVANPVIGHTIAITKPLLSLAVQTLRPAHYAMHDWALVLLASRVGSLIWIDARLGLYRQHSANVLGARRKRSIGSNIARARRLTTLAARQISAFQDDVRHAAARVGHDDPGPLLPGRGPLNFRLAKAFAFRGHTLGHRLAALFPLLQMLFPTSGGGHRK